MNDIVPNPAIRPGLFPRSRLSAGVGCPLKSRRARVSGARAQHRARVTRSGGLIASQKPGTREQVGPQVPGGRAGHSPGRGASRLRTSVGRDIAFRREDFAALVNVLETEGRFTPAPPDPPWADPRPDLIADHLRWLTLLELAYRHDAEDPNGVFGALVGIRCCGAAIVSSGGARPSWRLTRGEMSVAEWQVIRARWLMPHLSALQELLGTPTGAIPTNCDNRMPGTPAAVQGAAT